MPAPSGCGLSVISKFNPRQELFAHWANEPGNSNSLSGDGITSVLEDESGVLWIGTRAGGLNRFDRARGVFTHYNNEPGNRTSLSNNRVRAIYEDKAGTLWIGTGAGLNRLDAQEGIFTRFLTGRQNRIYDRLRDNNVRTILEDRAGALWPAGRLWCW